MRELIDLTTSYYPAPFSVDETLALTHTTALARSSVREALGRPEAPGPVRARRVRKARAPLSRRADGRTRRAGARDAVGDASPSASRRASSIVLTTHYLEEAEALADRVAVLAKGRLIASGSVRRNARHSSPESASAARRSLTPDQVRSWPGVTGASLDGAYLQIVAHRCRRRRATTAGDRCTCARSRSAARGSRRSLH